MTEHSPPEEAMSEALRDHRLRHWTFTQDFAIGPYVTDFACRERNLVIELDGPLHLERAAKDRARDEFIMRAGYSIFRVPQNHTLHDRNAFCASLLAIMENRIEDCFDDKSE